MNKNFALNIIRNQYNKEIGKDRKFKNIRSFFYMSEKEKYTIDDDTWNDMDMDRVYEKLDRTYSTPGESVLYYMLRNPLHDEGELKKRDKLIEIFKSNQSLREELLYILFELSIDSKNDFLYMIENELIVNKFKYYLYTILGKIRIISIILIFLFGSKFVLMLGISLYINMFINSKERELIKSRGILYLKDIIKASKKILNIKDDSIKEYRDNLNINLKEVRDIDASIFLIKFINVWQGIFEFMSVLFLIEECAYYKVSGKLKGKEKYLMKIFQFIGELDSLLSIAGYQNNLKETHVKPEFIKEVSLNIKDGNHLLLDNPVANSICIKDKGVVLTGTNMSGKSTFLRMLGVNIILAQTFYFTLAKEYKAPFFNIVSSISPNDNLLKGKSYYMAEAEGILRIINAIKKELPVFCPIDEIFRGTNPIERIAMSAEILTYINNNKTVPIVATHDRELADTLKESYEFYYFSEDVDSKNGLNFDYKLKSGVTQSRNAIKLLDYLGYPKELIKGAYRRAENIEGFI